MGSHSITVEYSGDGTFDPATSAPFVQTVGKASTTTTTTSNLPSPDFGDNVTFTATVATTAPGAGATTGTVGFTADTVSITGCTAQVITAGTATCTTNTLAGGTTDIVAVTATDANFNASTSPTLEQTVDPAVTSTALASDPNPSEFNESVELTATVASGAGTPGGTVAFRAGSTTISGCGTQTLTLGEAVCTTSALALGAQSLTAVYAGTANFATSTSTALVQNVAQAATTTGLVSSSNPSVYSGPLTFTATVASAGGTPTGSVAFRLGGTNIASCSARPLSAGVATCSTANLPTGPGQLITAHYLGATSYLTSTSSTVTQAVNKATTTTAVTSSPTSSVSGQSVTFTATVLATAPATATPAGAVAFTIDAAPVGLCTAQPLSVGGTATCTMNTLAVGTATVSAVYAGNTNNLASTSPDITHVVSKAATTTAVTSGTNPSVVGAGVTFTATVATTAPGTGTATGTVAFKNGLSDIVGCSAKVLAGGSATCSTTALPVGANTIGAVYATSTTFLASTAPTITQNVLSTSLTTIASNQEPSRFGESVTLTATITSTAGVPTGTVSFYAEQRDLTRVLIATRPLSAGAASTATTELPVRIDSPVIAEYSGSSTIAASNDTVDQTVSRSLSRTLLSSSANPSRFGQAVTLTVNVGPMGDGEGTPKGKVAFYRVTNGVRKWIGTAVLDDGIAKLRTSKTPVGRSDMIAQYNGNGNFRPSSRTGVQRVHAS